MFDERKLRLDLVQQRQPQVFVKGETSAEQYAAVATSFAYLVSRGSPPVTVLVDSGGGPVGPGLDIYDVIRLYQGTTTGLVLRRAASMAAIILQACSKRQCARHAGILIHHVSRTSVSLDQLRNKRRRDLILESMQKDQDRLYRILVDRTKQPLPLIKKECRKDKYMTAEEALAFGLIDEIV
jgi:ATP-dependent Clp protease protease subunit